MVGAHGMIGRTMRREPSWSGDLVISSAYTTARTPCSPYRPLRGRMFVAERLWCSIYCSDALQNVTVRDQTLIGFRRNFGQPRKFYVVYHSYS